MAGAFPEMLDLVPSTRSGFWVGSMKFRFGLGWIGEIQVCTVGFDQFLGVLLVAVRVQVEVLGSLLGWGPVPRVSVCDDRVSGVAA